jgi:hypothetical protein
METHKFRTGRKQQGRQQMEKTEEAKLKLSLNSTL